MKKSTKLAAIITVAALSAGSVIAFAAKPAGGNMPFQNVGGKNRQNLEMPDGETQIPGNGMWQGKMEKNNPGRGMQKAQKAAMTEEQLSEMKEKSIAKLDKELEKGKITEDEYNRAVEDIENGTFKPEKGNMGGFVKGEKPEMTEEQLSEMKEMFIAKLDEKLENGDITEDEYNRAVEDIENGTFKPEKGGMGGFKKPMTFQHQKATEEM